MEPSEDNLNKKIDEYKKDDDLEDLRITTFVDQFLCFYKYKKYRCALLFSRLQICLILIYMIILVIDI